MARLYISNTRGRPEISTRPKSSRTKQVKDETYQEKKPKKKRGGAKYGITLPSKLKRRQVPARVVSDDESTTSGVESAGGDNSDGGADAEDGDGDDDDEPADVAPSRTVVLNEAGRYQYDRSDDNLSEAGETDSMFGGSFNSENEEELQNRLLDDNDDAYQGVDDISDSDLDDEKIMEEQAKHFLTDFAVDDVPEDSEDPSFYLNQIEGMSAYGFGDDSDATAQFFGTSPSSDSGNETLTRHVRFADTFPERQVFRGLSQSPTMTRALLPSAMPATLMGALPDGIYGAEDVDLTDESDSDLTDEDLPEAALAASENDEEPEPEPETPAPSSVRKRPRPPPVGRFIDDGSQSAGILDSTGTMLLITNPQTLGEEFAKRYGASAPPSPTLDFADAVLGTTSNSPQTPGPRVPDPILSGLNSRANATASGQTVSIPEAFFPPTDESIYALNNVDLSFADDGSMYSDMDEGERLMRIEDIVAFDTDSGDESPTFPNFGQDLFSSPGLSHLNNGNVTAFRQNADPALRAFQSSPIASHSGASRARDLARSERRRTRKRKFNNDSPYDNQYYKGVTPVQRISHPETDSPMLASSPTKRQRIE